MSLQQSIKTAAFCVSRVGISNNFALFGVTVLTHSCTIHRTDTDYWEEISSLE